MHHSVGENRGPLFHGLRGAAGWLGPSPSHWGAHPVKKSTGDPGGIRKEKNREETRDLAI